MMKKSTYTYAAVLLSWLFASSCHSGNGSDHRTPLGKIALQESAIPIRPGKPGEVPFWNHYSKRFIYAPSFDFPVVKGAAAYRFEINCSSDSSTYSFESDIPYAPLTPVWTKMPVSAFHLKVIGLSNGGDSIGLAGEGAYYRAASFNGPYLKAEMPYDSSALVALSHIMHKSYVDYWLTHGKPDPSYSYYRYPAKMYSSLISGAVTYARLVADTTEAARAKRIAEIVADNLLKISFAEGKPWAYFPPTYYGEWIAKLSQASFIRLDNFMPNYGSDAGNAYLDLYDLTGNEKYLQASENIAKTFLKNQLASGSWNLYVNPQTGEQTADVGNIAIPAYILSYFDRLRENYHMKGLDTATEKAFRWMMENPVKTWDWQGQFEDVGTHEAYKDLSRKEPCQLAIYLLKNKSNDSAYVKLAITLIRFSEDQFVIWEKPRLLNQKSNSKGRRSTNWITPCAQEQYVYWVPTGPAAMRMVTAFWYAYEATHEKLYLAKAESIANAMTRVQNEHHGEYSTYFTKDRLGGEWLNCNVFSAQEMIAFSKNLKSMP